MDYKKQTLLNTVANVVYLIVQWLFTVFATRLINTEAAGVLTFAVSLTNILYCVENYGMRQYQVSDTRGEFSPKQYIRLRYLTTGIATVICIIYLLFSGFTPEKAFAVFFFFAYRAAEALSDVYFGELQRGERLHLTAYSMMLKSVVSLAVFVLLCFLTRALVWPLLAITVVSMLFVICDRFVYRKAERVVDDAAPAPLLMPLKVGFFLMLAMLFPIAVTSLPKMALEVHGEELLGHFGNVSMPTTLIVAIVPNVLTPVMSVYGRYFADREHKKTVKLYLFTLVGSVVVSAVFALGFLLLGEWFMSLVYGEDILEYLHYIYPLILTTMLYAFAMCNTSFLIAARSKLFVWISSAMACVISLVCCFALVMPLKIDGVILTLGISYLAEVIIQLVGIARILLSFRVQKSAEEI